MNTTEARILLVEDSPSDAALLQESLAQEHPGRFAVTHAESWAEARKHLKDTNFDVLLLDLSLPDISSRDTFIRARIEAPHLPIVLLTGLEDEAVGLDAVRHGIQDYLTKSQADGRLVARAIRYAIERKRVETELRNARAELELRVQERTADLRRTVKHIEGVAALLELFATKSSRKDYLDAVVKLLRSISGCHCVGVRLLDAQGFLPYAAHTGFSRQFLKHERALSVATPGGCACVRILARRPQPEDGSIHSLGGSLFCNQASRYVAQLGATPEDCANVGCVNAGYESLAHAPIRYRDKLLGTLHLADSRPGKFPAETIMLIEVVAPLVGEALHRFNVEESLHESEERFRSMFERHDAVMLLIDPQSGALVDANPAAAAFYGYAQDRLKTMSVADLDLMPQATLTAHRQTASKKSNGPLLSRHRLASGETRIVEVHSSPLRVKEQQLVFSIIHDITERKALEKEVLDISEQERQRFGQDLHDSLGGKLTGAALISKALAQKLADKDSAQSALAEEVVRCINESIGQTRAIAHGLCPVELTISGLTGGLREFAAETQRHSGVSCRFQAAGQVEIEDLFVATHLFRIAQEAVSNAIRHARPRLITLRLGRVADHLSLEIRDDGIGLPRNFEAAGGLGLRTMKYRAGLLGAQLIISSGEGGGTLISCQLPLSSIPLTKQEYAGQKRRS